MIVLLQGSHITVLSLPSPPYIYDMEPLGNGTFTLAGMYPDVFYELKVNC